MKAFGLLALAATAKLVSAHATVMAVWINDEDQGLGNGADGYIRTPPNNSPVVDVTSTDMTCNVNGGTPAASTLEVKAGDKITFEWHHNTRDASDDIIDLSHLGPVLVYMAETEKGSAGNGWVKIAEDGYTDGKWAVETLVENRGKHSIIVPDVPAGDYLFRPEIIALHEGNRVSGAQFYMECVQVSVTSSGSNTLPEGVSIPGAYSAQDPGVLFDLYNGFTSYPIPGPAVWDGASDSGSDSGSAPTTTSASAAPTVAPTTTQAVIPTSEPSEAPSSSSAAPEPEETSCPNDDEEDYEEEPEVTTTTSAPIITPEPTQAPTTTSAAPEPEDTSCPNDDDDYEEEPEVTSASAVIPTSAPSGFTTSARPTTTAAPAPTEQPSTGGSVKIWQRCGGIGHTGATTCEAGLTCKHWNPYYYQCIQE
ncbi:glycosyl hydrolase family 61-domain-containing protein [Aspergillus granulosus]|uniref:AA9 family lytic polysaccharide monooxygenase n=1 Tax=Aspergillus granulosus TaxID=176169 RepID=A0ABR4HTM2_9EURO